MRLILPRLALVAGLAAPVLVAAQPALSVNASANRHAISDDIYGMNYAPEALAAELRLPVRRWGGNSTSRYNYQIDVHNTGGDYYFENIPDGNGTEAGNSSNQFFEQDRRTSTRTLMTVPLMGWVPKRRPTDHPYDCGFNKTKYPGQVNNFDPFDTNCGTGMKPGGVKVVGNDPADTSVAIDPAFVTRWVNYLKGRYGTGAFGGVPYYNLDNEPALWNSTHRDVHPNPLTYDELRDRTFQYGAAVKAADPTAKTLGPAEWGWCNYFYSAADNSSCGPGADRNAHGNLDLVVWYLQQMKAYETTYGVRILDYLDLHYYQQKPNSETEEIALAPAGTAATQARRLRTTKSLWDPTYTDESWIADLGMGPNRFIPRMREWVAGQYPGTKIAITEYNWGALDHINGAVAQADVLGIFGREGLDLATIWWDGEDIDATSPGAFAFRMYRNYDGAGHGFGETSVQSTSTNQDRLAVYGSQRASDGALIIIVVNKEGTVNADPPLTSTVSLSGFIPQSSAAVYRYSDASPTAIQHLGNQAVTASGFSATFPPRSITLFVVLPSPGALAANQGTLGFGAVSMGATSAPQTVTITNNAGAVATITGITTSAQFTTTTTCGATLAAGASCDVSVSFAPSAAGVPLNTALAVAGSLTVSTSQGSPTIALAGTGEKSLITHYYRSILRRAPDAGGNSYWQGEATRLSNSGANVNETWFAMAQFFFFSAEYAALARDASGFVTDLYTTFFNRAPDAGGLAYWVGQVNSGLPREVVLAGFMFSSEFGTFTQGIFGNTAARAEVNAVMDFYRGLLARTPDQGGYDYWVGQFRRAQCAGAAAVNNQVESISSQFANGAEYIGKNRTNAQYVGDLYNAFLRRGGDLNGVNFWIGQLNTQSREFVRQQFIGTPEFQGRVSAIVAQGCLP